MNYILAGVALLTGALLQYAIQKYLPTPLLRLIFPFSLVLVYVVIAQAETSQATDLMEFLICCELGGTVIGASYYKRSH
ncbi:MAG: hypothetical protein ACOX7N_05280 [Lawsonibacter sp.]